MHRSEQEIVSRLKSCGGRFLNPYRQRVLDYPGRIFTFVDQAADLAAIDALCRSAQERGGAICIELGSGSGAHLIGLARSLPQSLCFGFELRFKRAVRTIEKSAAAAIGSTYVLNIDGREFDRFFTPASINRLHVNFPDPWEKKRQRKHRVLNQTFLDRAVIALKPGGIIAVKTDHQSYFREFAEFAAADSRFELLFSTEDLDRSPHFAGNITSEFEELFRAQALPICSLQARLR